MCGIFAMASGGDAVPTTLRALKLLEYRGYDSVGIAGIVDGDISLHKAVGRVEQLMAIQQSSNYCIGHTRWATHGEVSVENAHPFVSYDGQLALVHNGIIENSKQLRHELTSKGVQLIGQTDSEVVVHLLACEQAKCNNIVLAIATIAKRLVGSFALAILHRKSGNIYLVRQDSPLCVSHIDEGFIACSDVATISCFSTHVTVLPNSTIAVLNCHGLEIFDYNLNAVSVKEIDVEGGSGVSSSGCHMYDELLSVPTCVSRALQLYKPVALTSKQLLAVKRIYFVGCGTAYHSGVVASRLLSNLIDLDIHCVIASQFTYAKYPVDGNTLLFFISQSGETADTIKACDKAKALGGICYGIVNASMSTLSRKVHYVNYINAGREVAVASTKAYTNSVVVLTKLSIDIAFLRCAITEEMAKQMHNQLLLLPKQLQQLVDNRQVISTIADTVSKASAVFYIGRDIDYATAMESSLKLKEISYMHSEAYYSGELKHGTLALIDDTVVVVLISTDETMRKKDETTVHEIESRGGRVVVVSPYPIESRYNLLLPSSKQLCYPCLAVLPMQLLAYYCAVNRGCDIDKPKNLAKSVTVE